MDKDLIFKGMIKGMKDRGATFLKTDSQNVYFNVKVGSEIDDADKLKRAKDAFMKTFGLGIKVNKVS